jgi:Family of unknown function (DUF5989)
MNTTSEEHFEEAARSPRWSLGREFCLLLLHNKKWWMAPVLLVILLLCLFALVGSSPIAPFIYTLF